MKKTFLATAAALFILLLAVPAYSQDEPIEIQDQENFDILITPEDEAEIIAFADMLPEDEFEEADFPGDNRRAFIREFADRKPLRQRIHDTLNLTDAQQNKIEALRLDHQRKMIDLRASLQKAKLDEREMKNNDKISRSAVISSTEKINKIKNEMALARANHRMDVYEVLTPDQQKLWQDLKNDFPRHKIMRKGGGMMDGGQRRHMMR